MDIKNTVKTLTVMHLVLVIGLSIFTTIAFFQGKGFNTNTEGLGVFLFLVPVLALMGYFGSQIYFKKQMAKIEKSESLKVKLEKYKSASNIKYLMIDAPAFLGLFVYYSTGNALPLVISICLLAYLLAQRPTKQHIVNSLPLSLDEAKQFEYKSN